MKKLKSLILTMCFMMVVGISNVYATSRAIQYETTTSGTSSPPTAGGKTELDGQIGEWDPTDDSAPDFDGIDSSEIEGTIPGSDKYFTISATVPVSMEFIVLESNSSAFGLFYSPEYTIKNNGSKTLSVKVKEINQDITPSDPQKDVLYIERKIPGDNKSQMELCLKAIEGNKEKDIPLYDLRSLNDNQKTLYSLSANESKK